MHPRRRAHARERRAVVDADVVRVETGEAACLGLARQARVGEEPEARQLLVERPPLVVGRRRRVVDVEVGDPRRCERADLRREARRASARRTARRGPRPASPAARASRATSGSRAASTEPGPHHETITVCTPTDGDLAHLRPHDGRVRRRVRPAQREPVRRDLRRRRVPVLLPVLPGAVDAPASRTTGSRRSPPPPPRAAAADRARDARTGSAQSERRKHRHRSQGPPGVRRNPRETLTGRRARWKRHAGASARTHQEAKSSRVAARPNARAYRRPVPRANRARPTATSRSGSSQSVISTSAVASVRPAERQRPTTRCGTGAASRRKSQRRSTAIHAPGLACSSAYQRGRVDARREGAAVEERPRLLAAEGRRRRVEPEHDGVVEQLDGDEPDGGVERRRRPGEEIAASSADAR